MRKFEFDRKYKCGKYPVEAMETFFNSLLLPHSIDLDEHIHIKDVRSFVDSHIASLKKHQGNYVFINYYRRLVLLKELLVKMDEW